MPSSSDSLRNIANRLVGTDLRLSDSRNNPVSLPIQNSLASIQENLMPKKTISRTFVSSVDASSKIDMSGEDGYSILVSILNPDGTSNKPGFTPQSSYYFYGTNLLNPTTGFPKEAGHILCVATLANNCAVDKISRINLVVNESATDTKGKVLLRFSKESVKGKQNIWGNQNISVQDTFGGWVNPLHYITNPDKINPRTGLPEELGDFPFNYENKFGANYFRGQSPGVGINNLIPTTPRAKVDGPKNDGIESKKEVATHFREAKDISLRTGGFEMYDFIHYLDRLNALENPNIVPNDIYLASFVEVKEHEDPVWFGFDILIDYENSPLFNGAIFDFIREKQEQSAEVRARAEVYQNFVNQFRRFFKLQTSNDITDPSGTQSQLDLLVPVGNQPQNGRSVYKTFYIKRLTGLDFLVESLISNANDQIKSMVDYGKDLIKITLYEDLTINTGYLSMLYKTLSWSRLNGRQVIPENLLRFDCKIVIHELRNYNKVMKNNNAIEIYADDMNKYIYKLYDCQFMFDKMSHGDDINMWAGDIDKEFDIAFNFKYSNLTFEKNYSNRPNSIKKWIFDNGKITPISFNDVTNAANLRFYQRFEPNSEKTTDLVDAELRDLSRQLGGNSFDVAATPVPGSNPPDTLTPVPTEIKPVNQLDDVKLTQSFTPDKNPWQRFDESRETNLELLSKQNKNKDMASLLERSVRRNDIGTYNRKKDLITRSVSNVIEFKENQVIGVGIVRSASQVNVDVGAISTNTVDDLRLDKKDTRKITRFLQRNDYDAYSGNNTELKPGSYLFVSTIAGDLASAQQKAIDLSIGRPSNQINNLITGQSQIYYKKMNDGNYRFNFFSPIN